LQMRLWRQLLSLQFPMQHFYLDTNPNYCDANRLRDDRLRDDRLRDDLLRDDLLRDDLLRDDRQLALA